MGAPFDKDLLKELSKSRLSLYTWLMYVLKEPHKNKQTKDLYYLPDIINLAHQALKPKKP